MPQNAGQDIVEVVRDTAGQLPNRLHLRCLGDLALQLRFFGIVLQAEQHGCFAKPAGTGDRECYRIIGAVLEPYRDVARNGLSVGKTSHGVGHRCLILADKQVAGIDRIGVGGDARRTDECVIEVQETSVAVRKGKAQRQHRQQHLKRHVGPGPAATLVVDQHDDAVAILALRVERDLKQAERQAREPLMREANGSVAGGREQRHEITASNRRICSARCAQHHDPVRCAYAPLAADQGYHDASGA